MQGTTDNLDFLAAHLHGRRSRMATGGRLEALCQAATVPRLATEVLSVGAAESALELQRQLVHELAQELATIAAQLSAHGARVLRWLAVRFQLENLKVLLRGWLANGSQESLRPHLVELPREFAVDPQAAARSLDNFLPLAPRGPLRMCFRQAVQSHREEKRPFFFEAALDKGYLTELRAQAEALDGEDRELVAPLVRQEIDTFHLMLVARGKFIHGMEAAALLPFHVPGAGILRARFAAMLADPALRAAATRALGRALDELPNAPAEGGAAADAIAPSDVEALAWSRFQRLANRAFRRSHMGLAAVVAFAELRRVEVANLITLSEGIRLGMPAEQLRARLIAGQKRGLTHV